MARPGGNLTPGEHRFADRVYGEDHGNDGHELDHHSLKELESADDKRNMSISLNYHAHALFHRTKSQPILLALSITRFKTTKND